MQNDSKIDEFDILKLKNSTASALVDELTETEQELLLVKSH